MNGLFSSPRTASSTHVWKHGRWRGRKRERREDQTSPEARTQVEELTSRILQHRNMWRGEWAKLKKKKVFSLTETSFQNIKRWENYVRRVQTEEGNTCTFWVFLFYATLKLLFHQNERHYHNLLPYYPDKLWPAFGSTLQNVNASRAGSDHIWINVLHSLYECNAQIEIPAI